jgi:hypothetical protein
MIRRIGDGMDTCIWTDEWLPRDSSRKPYTPRGGSLLTRVHELIDPASGWWDEELVRATFWHEDAEVILSVPVHEGMDDMLVWHYNRNGIFSVKSAYKVYIADRDQNRANGQSGSSSASLASGDQIWKRLWKVDCPKKMLHFMWRLCHNSLALRVNLKRRGVKLENLCCLLCGRFDEDGAHLFFKFKCVKGVWAALQMEDVRSKLAQPLSAMELVWEVLKLEDSVQRRVITLLYLWWTERCRVREGETPRTQEQCTACEVLC